MDSSSQTRSERATGEISTLDWPAREPTKIFSTGIGLVALFSGIGLAVSLGLLYQAPCTGTDLNVGCVPMEMAGLPAE